MAKRDSEFINREISWLYFNDRVLQESANPNVPLIERLKFLGIFSNNMDEFFRVRVATLMRMSEMRMRMPSSKDDPAEVLKRISKMTADTQSVQEKNYANIKEELKKENIFIVDENQLTDEQLDFVLTYYDKQLEDEITPIMLSNSPKSFPELRDAHVYLFVKLSNSQKQDSFKYALIELPRANYSRFLVLPDDGDKKCVLFLDDVIRLCMPQLFRSLDYDTFEAYTVKITRDSEMEIEAELGEGIVDKVSKGIKSRRYGSPLRFLYDRTMPEEMLKYILKKIKFKKSGTIIAGGRYHNFKDFMSFPTLGKDNLVYPKNIGVENETIRASQSVIKAIEKQDLFLHYPYYSFSQYVQLLREAAIDAEVKSIDITLYRMANRSKVARALIFAAKNGKHVTAVVELRARFDEEHNILWAQRMEEAGINVVFGVEGLKIHSKLTLITKKNGKKVAAISTGNFHEGNAAVYTDFTLFTANKQITGEVETVFNFIHRPYQSVQFSHLLVSPQEMRKKINQMIQTEIINAKKGLPAYILCKINHITDYKMIEKLYEAAEAGVKIRAIVRGMCSVVTTQPKLKGNFEIVGIIDKFLEHPRMYIFCNNGVEKYYMSSGDWMTRNLDGRIEVAVPVYDKEIQKELKLVIEYGLKDNVQARICDATGRNLMKTNDEPPFRSQMELMRHYEELEERKRLEIENKKR
ncbi:MAG: RNA degradosome polyphosphate kinase [Porphyromonadaceae bacterium]|nr:RNA degradosome polyphosphate kinase [Porphyromonadaceae bacterium]